MSFLKYVALLPMLYDLIKYSVELVEDVTDDGVLGSDKKAAVMTEVKKAMIALGYGAVYPYVEPILSAAIDLTVGVFNTFKWKKEKKADPAPVVEGISTDGTTPDPE